MLNLINFLFEAAVVVFLLFVILLMVVVAVIAVQSAIWEIFHG